MIIPITVHFLRYTRSRVVQSNLPTNLSKYLDKFNLVYGHCDDIIGSYSLSSVNVYNFC